MEAVQALEPSHQDLVVAYALLGPTFQNLINAKSFDSMKFVIFQIGVVNDFGHAKHGPLSNAKTFNQRFKSAAVAMMAKLGIYHSVPHSSFLLCGCLRKDEFCFGINKVADQPGRTNAIDFRAWTGDPD